MSYLPAPRAVSLVPKVWERDYSLLVSFPVRVSLGTRLAAYGRPAGRLRSEDEIIYVESSSMDASSSSASKRSVNVSLAPLRQCQKMMKSLPDISGRSPQQLFGHFRFKKEAPRGKRAQRGGAGGLGPNEQSKSVSSDGDEVEDLLPKRVKPWSALGKAAKRAVFW